MLAAIVWKEWRQQGTLALAIPLLAAIAVAAVAMSMPNEFALRHGGDSMLRFALLVTIGGLAAAQGVVTGSIVFAGEKDDRTQDFLDQHSGLRFPVWRAKLVAGLSIVAVSSILLGALIGATGLAPAEEKALVLLPLWLAVDVFVWSTIFSALLPSTYAALAVSLSLLLYLVAAPFGMLAPLWWPLYFFVKLLLMAGAAGLSWRVYCGDDLRRRGWIRSIRRPAWKPSEPAPVQPGWIRAALWRSRFTHLMAAGAIVLIVGTIYFILQRSWNWRSPQILWPIATFLIGSVAGILAFAEDRGSPVFLGDQRLPPGRVWLGKVLPLLILAAAASVLVAVMVAVVGPFHWEAAIRGFHEAEWPFHYRWLPRLSFCVYGFAVAAVLAQQCRKAPVAVFLSLVLGGVTAALWFPSQMRAMPEWRMWVVPVVLLIASRLSMRRWMTDRLHDRRGAAWVVGVTLLLAGWLAGNLWWRVHEFPDPGEPVDVAAVWKRMTASPDHRGQELRQATRDALERVDRIAAQRLKKPEPDPLRDEDPPEIKTWPQFCGDALMGVFPENAGVYQEILDEIFEGDWVEPFRQAALAEPDRYATLGELRSGIFERRQFEGIELFLIRAQLRAKKGDVDGTIADFDVALSALRHAIHRSNGSLLDEALYLENWATGTVAGTIEEKIFDNPVYRTKLAALLARHDEKMPDAVEMVEAICLNPNEPRGDDPRDADGLFVAPWEQARADRFRRRVTARLLEQAKAGQFLPFDRMDEVLESWGGGITWRPLPEERLAFRMAYTCQRYARAVQAIRETRLVVAVAEFERAHGRLPRTPDELTPKYLPRIPDSPYVGGEFRLIEARDIDHTRFRGEFVPGQGLIVDDGDPKRCVPLPIRAKP